MDSSPTTWNRALIAAVALALAMVATPVAATTLPARSGASGTQATDGYPGAVTIEPATWTASAEVTLHLKPPTNADSMLRLSNDGVTWLERPFASTVPWSLIDPAAGGTDADGSKTVYVLYGDGATWDLSWSDTVTLDRVAPSATDITGVAIDGKLWRGTVSGPGGGPLIDMAATRYSLDGTTWQPWSDGNVVDVWNAPGAAAWYAGDRQLLVQLRDSAGNESDVIETTATVAAPVFGQPDLEENLVDVSFETPDPAITGHPFTIRVVYPAGYTLPTNARCQWLVHWGDDESIMSNPNPSWGELLFDRGKSSGACTEWTFTLPYRSARQFSWMFQLGTKGPNVLPGDFSGGLYVSGNGESQVFRALLDGTSERFLASNIPFAYVLPETTVSQKGDPVTYRLHTVGTSTVPQDGMFWTYPLNCYLNPQWSQTGGTTFTYRPNCDGPWVTGWTGVMNKGYMRSQYDPLVDGRAPNVSAPVVRLRTSGFGAGGPGTVSWSARDGGSGVWQYRVAVSRNGGSWQPVELASRLTTSVSKTLALSGTYRYRVQARDRVGNWSDWKYGPTIRAEAKQESSSSITWTGAWAKVADAALSGGAARATTSSAATARLTAYARSLAWVSRTRSRPRPCAGVGGRRARRDRRSRRADDGRQGHGIHEIVVEREDAHAPDRAPRDRRTRARGG